MVTYSKPAHLSLSFVTESSLRELCREEKTFSTEFMIRVVLTELSTLGPLQKRGEQTILSTQHS